MGGEWFSRLSPSCAIDTAAITSVSLALGSQEHPTRVDMGMSTRYVPSALALPEPCVLSLHGYAVIAAHFFTLEESGRKGIEEKTKVGARVSPLVRR